MSSYPYAIDRGRLRDAYIELLSRYPLQWFCTLTFRHSVHPEHAFKLFRVWTNEINRQLYGLRWHQRGDGIYWVLAWEYQRRGVLHFHALVGDAQDLNTRVWRLERMDRWDQLAGFARVEEIKGHAAVERYVSKYVVKGGQLDFSRSLTQFASQRSLSDPRISRGQGAALLALSYPPNVWAGRRTALTLLDGIGAPIRSTSVKLDISIEIKSRDVLTKRGIASKTGKPFEIHEQIGYVELEKPYPLEMRVPVESPEKPYTPGSYLVDPSCVYVNRYGQLQLGRVKLLAVQSVGRLK